MMPTLNSKNLASAAPESGCTRRPASRPGVIPCLIASMLIAVPLPAFAEKGDLPSAFNSLPNPSAVRFLTATPWQRRPATMDDFPYTTE